jgi:hypothetical protein
MELAAILSVGITLILFLLWADHKWPDSVGHYVAIFVLTGCGLMLPFFWFALWLEKRRAGPQEPDDA